MKENKQLLKNPEKIIFEKDKKVTEPPNIETAMVQLPQEQSADAAIDITRENYKKIEKTRNDILEQLEKKNKERSAGLEVKELKSGTWTSENPVYHQGLKNRAEEIAESFKKQTSFMQRMDFASRGYPVFMEILKFLGEHGANGHEFLLEKLRLSKLSDERLASITDIKPIILESGQPGYVVKIDKSKWMAAIFGPGVAFKNQKVAFVADGLSDRSVGLIEDHEIYHLNHPHAGELQTVMNANLNKDVVGSAGVLVQTFINTPKWFMNAIKEVIKKVGH